MTIFVLLSLPRSPSLSHTLSLCVCHVACSYISDSDNDNRPRLSALCKSNGNNSRMP